jgi:hypothetical protein
VDKSTSWHWFFNHFSQTQFKKEHCLGQIIRYLSAHGDRLPKTKTLERDVGCLLSSYARIIPEENSDPEENYNCPFRELEMLIYFKDTSTYHLNRNIKNISGFALGYCLSLSTGAQDVERSEISVSDAATELNGPGKCFGLQPNELFTLVETIMQSEPKCGLKLVSLAGKRMLEFPILKPNEWVSKYFTEDFAGCL